jgi:hypothetical protein
VAISYRSLRYFRRSINHRCHEIDEYQGQGLITGIKDHRQYPDTGEQLVAGVVVVYQNLLTMRATTGWPGF